MTPSPNSAETARKLVKRWRKTEHRFRDGAEEFPGGHDLRIAFFARADGIKRCASELEHAFGLKKPILNAKYKGILRTIRSAKQIQSEDHEARMTGLKAKARKRG